MKTLFVSLFTLMLSASLSHASEDNPNEGFPSYADMEFCSSEIQNSFNRIAAVDRLVSENKITQTQAVDIRQMFQNTLRIIEISCVSLIGELQTQQIKDSAI